MEEIIDQLAQPANPQIEPLVWQAEEFETHRRGWAWYLVTILVLALLITYTVYTRQWLLTGVVVAVGIILYLSNRMKPRLMDYRVDSGGLSIGAKTFAFDQLKSFWLHIRDGQTYLNVISTQRLMPVITIKVTGVDINKIREALSKHIPESANQGEDWVDKINRFLKV